MSTEQHDPKFSQAETSSDDAERIAAKLAELRRLREIAMAKAEALDRAGKGSPKPTGVDRVGIGPLGDIISQFVETAAMVRQLIVLEWTVTGTPRVPSRDIFDDTDDYDYGPIETVVDRIRKALGEPAPADDPFGPPPSTHRLLETPPSGGAWGAPARPSRRTLLGTTHLGTRTLH
jgi:hypothetical protein